VKAAREMIGEPCRQRTARPSVQLQVRPLRDVVPNAVPVESRLPADVQAYDSTLQQSQARVANSAAYRFETHTA
jgi:hypothetical protein